MPAALVSNRMNWLARVHHSGEDSAQVKVAIESELEA